MTIARASWAIAPLLLATLATGCNKSNRYAGCDTPDDSPAGLTTLATTRRIEVCKPSGFETNGILWRDVSGIVWRGDNGVDGSVLGISPLAPPGPTNASATTGTNGFFGPIHGAALQYDMTVRADADVLGVKGYTTRYAQPSFDGPRNLAGGYRKPLAVQLDPPPDADHAVVFFATGGTAYGVSGDLEHGLTLVDSTFDATATIHAVEYVRGKDLLSASAYGKADATSNPTGPKIVAIHLDPITDFSETTLTIDAPPGFSAKTAELSLVYSRSSLAHFTTMTLGAKVRLPVIPNRLAYAYRIQATSPDGAIADTGEKALDFGQPTTTAEVFAAPKTVSPAGGAAVDATTTFTASGGGVFEHLFVPDAPASGAGAIRVVTADTVTTLPELSLVGAPLPSGTYTWTVRSYPLLEFVESLAGIDAGRYDASTVSAPRKITFRRPQ